MVALFSMMMGIVILTITYVKKLAGNMLEGEKVYLQRTIMMSLSEDQIKM